MSSAAATLPRESSHRYLLSALPDERLAKLAAQGSASAFAAIYKRHHQEIYRYCQSLIGNEQDARDALQETMIKAMRALAGEPREIALRPWLFRIAHNESVSLMRRRRPAAPLDSVGEMPSHGGDADEAREQVRELFDDLSHLTPRQRGALVMRELNGLGYEEIAATMTISPAAAKQTVYEARQALLEVAKGRETDCREVRKRISARDRRLLRGRAVSAHLRTCADCRDFEAGIATRSTSLAAVAPLPATASAGILQSVLGVAGGSAGGGGIATAVAGGSLGAVAKLAVAGVIALGVGTVAIEARDSEPHSSAGGIPVIERAASAAAGHVQGGPGASADEDVAAKGGGGGEPGAGGRTHTAAHAGGPADVPAGGDFTSGPAHESGAGPGATPQSPPAGGTANADPGSGGGPATGNAGGESGGGGGGGTGTATGSSTSTGSTQGGGSTGGEVLPPGHGGTPPGQGGTPPGQGGTPSPGQGGTPPGQGGTPPGQGGTPPGQIEEPPDPSGTAPGHSANAPGHSANAPPDQGGTPPGHGDDLN
jgi:RNA polymerase sigma factor (sigma-70 family)